MNYGNRLTGGEQDGDPFVEADLVYADGHRETKTFPPEGAHGERLERYQSLARRLTPPQDIEAADSTMFAYLGGAMSETIEGRGSEGSGVPRPAA